MEKEYIKTSDLDLASALFTLGIPIDGIYASGKLDSKGDPVMEFYFDKKESTAQMIKDYYAKKLTVDPSSIFIVRREIIARMKAEQRTQL